jgi:hypothetical protein
VSWKACESCGMHKTEGHPIPHCYGCDREGYDRAFAELRKDPPKTHFLGYDPYTDILYVWVNGNVAGVEGRCDKYIRVRKIDDLVRRITDLEGENKDVLAENARLRRRLEGKPAASGREGK